MESVLRHTTPAINHGADIPATRTSLLATLFLLLMFGFAVQSMADKSPTYDEQGFLVRGLGYLRGENDWMRVGHPAGLNVLNALLLKNDAGVRLPPDHASWQETGFHRPAELFLWEIGNDVEHVMFLARVPTVWLGVLLAALSGRFAWAISRRRAAGLFALALVALDPNMIAHMRLTTTDLGLVAGAVLATYTLWRFLSRPTWQTAIVAGIGFGILQNTKFTAGLFVPLFTLLIVVGIVVQWRTVRRFPTKMIWQLVLAYPLAGFLTLWACYGFEVGTLSAELPTFTTLLGGRTLPLAHHIEQLTDIGGRMEKATPAFLRGDYSDHGWWYYFPVAFALKTPLPTLLLFVFALILSGIKRARNKFFSLNNAALLIPAVGFFAISMTNDINIGYRHIMVVIPLIAVYVSTTFIARLAPVAVLLVVWLMVETVVIAPHFIPYFNQLGGGADNGWRSLVDSNLDWGQDLRGLKSWMDENGVEAVRLSYFGEGRPEYYGINYVGLPSSPPRLMHPQARTYTPLAPAPGIYAISATTLQGVMFDDHDTFAWFRERDPVAKIGYSIFIYEVAARGGPVDVALGGVQIDEIDAADLALFGGNDLRLHWFDAGQSLLVPETGGWIVTREIDRYLYGGLREKFVTHEAAGSYELYEVSEGALTFLKEASGSTQPVVFNPLRQHKIVLHDQAIQYDDQMRMGFVFEQQGAPAPVKFFVHVENMAGELVAQWDGLGANWKSWNEGDWLLVSAEIPTPTTPGDYKIWLGMYDPDTGERWQTDGVDRYYWMEIGVE